MKKHEIVFEIGQNEDIVFALEEPIAAVDCCYEVRAILCWHGHKFLLNEDVLKYQMSRVKSLLSRAIMDQLVIHKSIGFNIGSLFTSYRFYSFDRELSKQQGLIFDEENEWVGSKHLLFAHDIAVWIYNDQRGAIILEFTPWYKGNNFDFEGETDFTQYEQFLKDYKPLFIRTISRDIAQQWLNQANGILKQIAENIERFENEQEAEHE